MGLAKAARPVPVRTGERPLDEPEEFRLQKIVGNGCAVDLHKRPFAAAADLMNDLCRQILARSCGPFDQDGGFGAGHDLDGLLDLFHGRIPGDHGVKPVFFRNGLIQMVCQGHVLKGGKTADDLSLIIGQGEKVRRYRDRVVPGREKHGLNAGHRFSGGEGRADDLPVTSFSSCKQRPAVPAQNLQTAVAGQGFRRPVEKGDEAAAVDGEDSHPEAVQNDLETLLLVMDPIDEFRIGGMILDQGDASCDVPLSVVEGGSHPGGPMLFVNLVQELHIHVPGSRILLPDKGTIGETRNPAKDLLTVIVLDFRGFQTKKEAGTGVEHPNTAARVDDHSTDVQVIQELEPLGMPVTLHGSLLGSPQGT